MNKAGWVGSWAPEAFVQNPVFSLGSISLVKHYANCLSNVKIWVKRQSLRLNNSRLPALVQVTPLSDHQQKQNYLKRLDKSTISGLDGSTGRNRKWSLRKQRTQHSRLNQTKAVHWNLSCAASTRFLVAGQEPTDLKTAALQLTECAVATGKQVPEKLRVKLKLLTSISRACWSTVLFFRA